MVFRGGWLATEGGWIMIFEPEKLAPHGDLGGSVPRIGVYRGNLRALHSGGLGIAPVDYLKHDIGDLKTFLVYIYILVSKGNIAPAPC